MLFENGSEESEGELKKGESLRTKESERGDPTREEGS